MRALHLVGIDGRRSADSTEIYLKLDLDVDEVYLELWRQDARIGYVRLARFQQPEEFRAYTFKAKEPFEIAELLPADFPCPGPLVSLSGVLWSERELHESLAKYPSFPPGDAQEVRSGVLQKPILKADKQSREAYYQEALKTGLAQSELRSTSGRNPRGRK